MPDSVYCGRFVWDDDISKKTNGSKDKNKMLVDEIRELNCNVQKLNSNLKGVLKMLIDKKHQDR